MKKVDTILAMARKFPITWDKDKYDECYDIYVEEGGEGTPYALCSKSRRKVYLNEEMIQTAESAIEAVVHEGGEGMMDFLGVEVDHDLYEGICALLVNMMIQSGIIDPDEFIIAGKRLADLRREK